MSDWMLVTDGWMDGYVIGLWVMFQKQKSLCS